MMWYEKSYQAFIPAVTALCVWPLSYQQKSHEYKFLHIRKRLLLNMYLYLLLELLKMDLHQDQTNHLLK